MFRAGRYAFRAGSQGLQLIQPARAGLCRGQLLLQRCGLRRSQHSVLHQPGHGIRDVLLGGAGGFRDGGVQCGSAVGNPSGSVRQILRLLRQLRCCGGELAQAG